MRNTTLTILRIRLATALTTLLLLALPLGADAAGLGRLTVLSALGQPLRAEVEISASREELSSVSARIATPAAFQQAGIEYSTALAGIRFSIGQRPDGQPFLSMLSERAFNEPFLDLLVELSWSSGRLLREYTFLLDPPEAQRQGAAAAPLALPEVKRETAVAAVSAPVAPVQAIPAPATASTAAQPELRTGAPVEEKAARKPQPDLQVIRGADGVQRIVKVAPAMPEKPQQEIQTRLVKQGDTLGKIAVETKPAGVNLDQMLVALFRGNQEAFVGNVNRLKAGKILTIPDRETVAGVAADEARKTIQAHAADFNAYSKKLAATVASAGSRKEAAPQREVSGKITPRVEEKPPAAVGKDKLEVSKSEATAAAKAGATRLAAIEETLVSREKALKDANGRIAELEKNLADLKKLVELKNQSMAELQKQAQAAKPAAPVAAAKEPPAAPQKPVAKAADKPAESIPPPPAAKPAEPVLTPATAKPAEPVQPPAAPKPAAAEKKPAPPPPPPAEPSFIDDSPEIVFGGGAVLALLLGYLGYSRWRKQKSTETPAAADAYALARSMASDASMGKVEQGEDLLSPTDFSSQPGGMEPSASVDPVAEAEVYLAYGRDVQAEEILVDALKIDSTRLAIHLKLLEIYAARKSVKQFETIATDLHGQTGGTGPDWEKARQLGQQVDPENSLYAGQQETQAEFDPGATLVIQPQTALEDIELAAAETPAEDLMQEAAADESAPGSEDSAAEEVPVSLDFDFDLPLAAQISTGAESPAEPAAQEEPLGSLDIDLGQEAGVALPESSATASTEPAAATEAPAQQEATQSMEVDFDLALGTPQPAATEPATAPPAMTAEVSATADAGLDFDFDLGSSEPGAGPAQAAPAEDAAPAEPADGNTIDFDLELPASAAATPAATNIDLSSISLDLDAPLEPAPAPAAAQAPGLDESALQDVATKLELAQAYEEMGDKEGARELLQEVLNEGNAAQQETARNKLAQLG